MTAPLDPVVKLERKIARLEADNSQLRRYKRLTSVRGSGFDDLLEGMKELLETERVAPLTYYPTQITKAKARKAVPAVDPQHSEIVAQALSDWHLTENVRKEDSNGVNEYNSLICANRAYDLSQCFKQIFTIHQSAYKLTKIWLPILGDMISGSIHPEFLITNDMSDQSAVLLCARLLEMFILELKQLGVPIEADCVVGNHPRTTVKVPTKGLAHSNLDWVVYMILQMLFENDDQVNIRVHTGQLALVEHFDHRYAIEHGIDWKNGREEEFESKIRDLLDDPIYRKATGLKGSAFDQVVIGNLHKPAFLERTVKNGSLIGQNELGQQWRLKPIKAQQLAWGISRNHPRTFQYPIDVTDQKSSKVLNPFSEFTANFMKHHGRFQTLQ